MSTTIDQDLQAADEFNARAAMHREYLIRDTMCTFHATTLSGAAYVISSLFQVPDAEDTDDFRDDLQATLKAIISRHDEREAATIIADTLIAHRARISAEVE